MRGSIVKRKGGYAVVLELPRGVDKKKRRQKWLRGGRTRKEAELVLRRALSSIDTGTFVEDLKLTVAQFLDQWLVSAERKVRSRTLERYRALCKTLSAHIGSLPLLALTPAAIEECYNKLLQSGRVVRAKCRCGHSEQRHANRISDTSHTGEPKKSGRCSVRKCRCDQFHLTPRPPRAEGKGGLAARTVLHCHRVLSLALRQAVRWKNLSVNPCDAVDPPRVSQKEMRTLSEAEANCVIEAAKGTRLELFIVLALAIGARRGELLDSNGRT